jgi:hypothetical protein
LGAAIEVALIRLTGDGNVSVFVILVVGWCGVGWCGVGWCGVASSRVLWCRVVWGRGAGSLVFRLVAGWYGGSNSQECGDEELSENIVISLKSKVLSVSRLGRISDKMPYQLHVVLRLVW